MGEFGVRAAGFGAQPRQFWGYVGLVWGPSWARFWRSAEPVLGLNWAGFGAQLNQFWG